MVDLLYGTSPHKVVYMSDGTPIGFIKKALGGSPNYLPYIAVKKDYTQYGWVGVSTGSYPGTLSFEVYDYCQDPDNLDKVFVLGKYNGINVGFTAQWNGTSFAITGGTSSNGSSPGTMTIGGPANLLYHDGANVHLLARNSSTSYNRGEDGGNYTNYSASVQSWAVANWTTSITRTYPLPGSLFSAAVTISTGPAPYFYPTYIFPGWTEGAFLGTSQSGHLVVGYGPGTTSMTGVFYLMELNKSTGALVNNSSIAITKTGYNPYSSGDACMMADGRIYVGITTTGVAPKFAIYTTSLGEEFAVSGLFSANYIYLTSTQSATGPLRVIASMCSVSGGTTYMAHYAINESREARVITGGGATNITGISGTPIIWHSKQSGTSVWFWIGKIPHNYYEDVGLASALDTNAAPAAIPVSPVSGAESFDHTVDTITLDWDYSDADERGSSYTQSAYEVKVSENYAGAVAKYLTIVGSLSNVQASVTTSATEAQIPPSTLWTSNYGYQWAVRAQDSDAAWGSWSSWNTFRVGGRPVAQIIYPANNGSSYGNWMTVSWVYSDPEGTSQQAYSLRLLSVSGVPLWASGDTYTVDLFIAPMSTTSARVEYLMTSGQAYTVGLKVQDGAGIWSSESFVTFTAYNTSPPTPTWTISPQSSVLVNLQFTTPNAYDRSELHRWSNRLQKYVKSADFVGGSIAHADVAAPLNTSYTYKVIAYIGDIAHEFVSNSTSLTNNDWLICGQGLVCSGGVTGMSYGVPVIQQALEPMGRSKQVIMTSNPRGAEGDLSFKLTADEREQFVADLLTIASAGEVAYIKTPFGGVHAVLISTPAVSWDIAGRAIVTVHFIEVEDA